MIDRLSLLRKILEDFVSWSKERKSVVSPEEFYWWIQQENSDIGIDDHQRMEISVFLILEGIFSRDFLINSI